MESGHHNITFNHQVFDMSVLAAAMTQRDESTTYQHPRHSVGGFATSAFTGLPIYDTSLLHWRYANFQHGSADDFGKQQVTHQSRAFNSNVGDRGLRWHSFPARYPTLGRQTMTTEASTSSQPNRHPSQRTTAFSNPRGPPRKPKCSGHALWVGNLPPLTRIEDLKDHFSNGLAKEIESVFLISKSNCAFVNYLTENACITAMNRFHNSQFRERSLTCRLRRTTSRSSAPATSNLAGSIPTDNSRGFIELTIRRDPSSPVIVGGSENPLGEFSSSSSQVENGAKPSIPAKYFILKSLTVEDLEASVVTCDWATQPHNEDILNKAYEEADSVYLIFSANKSGEFFGYARMTSLASIDAKKSVAIAGEVAALDSPQTIPTPATATTPKGRITDDSARGSIFWEADHSDDVPLEDKGAGTKGDKALSIEWLSTLKIPFYQTRGMRNPLNGNREIKVARDGQELDPRVGRRLVQLFSATL